jgi:hypothetical protein
MSIEKNSQALEQAGVSSDSLEQNQNTNSRRDFLEKAGLVAAGLLILNTTAIAAEPGQLLSTDTIGGVLEKSGFTTLQIGRVSSRVKALPRGSIGKLMAGQSGNADSLTLGELKSLTDTLVERFGAGTAVKPVLRNECPSCCGCCS